MNKREELIHAAATSIVVEAVAVILFIGMLLVWAAILGGVVHG